MPGNSEMPSHIQHLAISFVNIKSQLLILRNRRNWKRKASKIDPWRPFSPFCGSVSTFYMLMLSIYLLDFHLSAVPSQPSCKPVPPILQRCFSHFTARSHPFHRAIWLRLHGKMGEIGTQGVSS